MSYYVSRQHYYYSDKYVVEVAAGGIDYSGADMLCSKYDGLGEGHTFEDPRAAVDAAQRVLESWRRDVGNMALDKQYEIEGIAVGYSHGFTAEFDTIEHDTAKEWAEKIYETLTKCAWCGNLLGDDPVKDWDDNQYCNDYCFERANEPERPDIEELWKAYKESGFSECPQCGGEITGGEFDYELEVRWIQCTVCGLSFYEVNTVVGIGIHDHDGEPVESISVEQNIE